jgi:hypothetical protein
MNICLPRVTIIFNYMNIYSLHMNYKLRSSRMTNYFELDKHFFYLCEKISFHNQLLKNALKTIFKIYEFIIYKKNVQILRFFLDKEPAFFFFLRQGACVVRLHQMFSCQNCFRSRAPIRRRHGVGLK